MTQTQKLLKVWKEYEREHNHMPSGTREAVEWGVERGLISPPTIDPMDILADQMSRVLREEVATDAKGRRYRVNHAVRIMKNGIQHTIWGSLGYTDAPHMEMSFTQRREQIIGDCHQLKTDVDVYNDKNKGSRQYMLDLNFTEDVAEREMGREDKAA